jgi:hypothetical protein
MCKINTGHAFSKKAFLEFLEVGYGEVPGGFPRVYFD